MILRTATLDDLQTLRMWDEEPDVADSGGDDDNIDWETELPRIVPWREFLIAEQHGRPIGFLHVIDPAEEETHYWGDIEPNLRAIDVWIGAAADRGRGLGTLMMQLALARCFEPPQVAAVLVDPLASNERAHRFYQRLGFEPEGRRMFGSDDTLVHRLRRSAWLSSRPQGPAGD